MTYAPVADRGVHGVNSRRGAWIVALALVAGATALALAFHAWRGVTAGDEGGASMEIAQLLDGVVPARNEAPGKFYADLEQHLRWQPSDARALIFKARLDMDAQRYEQAAAAYEKAVAGASKAANDPGVWVEYAEARGMAQGRTLAGEPLKLIYRALSLDGNHAPALDLAGSAEWELGNFAEAAVYWKRLLSQLPPGTARHTELSQAIERAQRRASVSLPVAHGELSRQRPVVKAD